MDWILLSGLSNLAGRRSPFKGLKLLRASGCQLAEFLSVYSGKCKTNRLPEIQKWLLYCFFTSQIVLHCFSAAALHFCSKNFLLQLTTLRYTYNNYLLTYDSYGPVYNRFHRGEWITWAPSSHWPK